MQVYLRLYGFDTFYLADLNAIQGDPTHYALIDTMLQRYPELTFWIDSGYQASPALYSHHSHYYPVLGSESYNASNYLQLANFGRNFILSLDFAGNTPLGAEALFKHTRLWPERVIIMNLKQVGSAAGPDLAKLQSYQQRYPQQQFIAAGGISHQQDLQDLQQLGINSVLVASALHSGALSL